MYCTLYVGLFLLSADMCFWPPARLGWKSYHIPPREMRKIQEPKFGSTIHSTVRNCFLEHRYLFYLTLVVKLSLSSGIY